MASLMRTGLRLSLLSLVGFLVAGCGDEVEYKKPSSYTIYYHNLSSNHPDVTDSDCRSDIKLYYQMSPKQKVLTLSPTTRIEDITWKHGDEHHGIFSFSGSGHLVTEVKGRPVESKMVYKGYTFVNSNYGVGIFSSKYCKGFYSMRVRY